MTIRRFDVTEDRACEYEVYGDMVQDSSGAYVLFEDYHVSHAYDEAKERELFEVYALEILGPYFMKPQDCLTRSGGTYTYGQPATAWCAWQSCAKSRARSAE